MKIENDKIGLGERAAELFAHVRVVERLDCQYIRVQTRRANEKPKLSYKWGDYLDQLGRHRTGSAMAAWMGWSGSPGHSFVMQEDSVQLAETYWEAIVHISIATRGVVMEGMGDIDNRYI